MNDAEDERAADDSVISPEPTDVIVTEAEAGERLDRVLVGRDLGTRSAIQRWIAEGRVVLPGEAETVLTSRTRVALGMVLRLSVPPPPVSAALPEPLPLDVVFEDDHLLVVDKPAGQVVHPAPGHERGTLVNALLHHARFEDGGDARRPGIVHRIDKDTSGLLVVAKSARAREGLVASFKAHDIRRRYEAVIVGPVEEAMTFDTLHGRHPRDRKRFSSRVNRGKRAVTHLRLRRRLAVGAALVQCALETGRTHQIRVHLADHGAPILADPIYGKRLKDPRQREAARAIDRLALHAGALGFAHPVTAAPLHFTRPPPDEFRAAVAVLTD